MCVAQNVNKFLDWYNGDPPGMKAKLARIHSTGKPGGTGKLVILPEDQGFEYGPWRGFATRSRGQRKLAPEMLNKTIDIYLGKA